MQSFVSNKGFKSGWRQMPTPPPSLNRVKATLTTFYKGLFYVLKNVFMVLRVCFVFCISLDMKLNNLWVTNSKNN